MDDDKQQAAEPPKAKPDEREARLAEALRANLRRRKQASRPAKT